MQEFNDVVNKLNNGDFVSFDSDNLVFLDKSGKKYDVNLIYDPITKEIWPSENFDDFIQAYRQNVQEVSAKSMLKNLGEIDEDLLNGDICWIVTDNIKELLAIGKPSILDSEDPRVIIPFMKHQLSQNKLLIIGQDLDSSDHWFAIIGSQNNAYIVEYLPNICNFSETFIMNDLLNLMNDILLGNKPDRFYGKTGKHTFKILSYERKPLWSNVVETYINKLI